MHIPYIDNKHKIVYISHAEGLKSIFKAASFQKCNKEGLDEIHIGNEAQQYLDHTHLQGVVHNNKVGT